MNNILKAAQIIKQGGVVAFPTETVYGLGADATNETACQMIYELKSRPANNPLIVHVASLEQAEKIAVFSPLAKKAAQAFWPGPISFVLPLKHEAKIAGTVTAGLKTIAIRIPDNEIALSLIKEAGIPIAAPSANPSGYISPTTSAHVKEHFSEKEVMILEGGASVVGIESTIIDFSTETPILLRQGFITAEDIESIIHREVSFTDDNKLLKAPGMMEKHYSPSVNVRLNAINLEEGEIGLGFSFIEFNKGENLSKSGSLIEAASNLYLMLRSLDKIAQMEGYDTIAVAPIPFTRIGVAINDRLKRAAAK
ncbi:MAG: ywlC [Rickettsiaceae bacterium]|jgi:L-threonylcarbamoyladenylate synthase|nr:ywlC [Rickettsiaceae bacterium]